MYMYFLYVIGTWGIFRLCAVANIVALVLNSEVYVSTYVILIYMVCMAGSEKSAGISEASLGYY